MSDIIITGLPEGKEKENGIKEIFELIMVDKFPELITLIIQKGQ